MRPAASRVCAVADGGAFVKVRYLGVMLCPPGSAGTDCGNVQVILQKIKSSKKFSACGAHRYVEWQTFQHQDTPRKAAFPASMFFLPFWPRIFLPMGAGPRRMAGDFGKAPAPSCGAFWAAGLPVVHRRPPVVTLHADDAAVRAFDCPLPIKIRLQAGNNWPGAVPPRIVVRHIVAPTYDRSAPHLRAVLPNVRKKIPGRCRNYGCHFVLPFGVPYRTRAPLGICAYVRC